ncbi:MAG: hypothetical protein LBP59_18490 [Planctomycetaceae bacterium]|nr:hypothetical protein [Planctomycetaceae bacterium]
MLIYSDNIDFLFYSEFSVPIKSEDRVEFSRRIVFFNLFVYCSYLKFIRYIQIVLEFQRFKSIKACRPKARQAKVNENSSANSLKTSKFGCQIIR